jgi:hypothetical protein
MATSGLDSVQANKIAEASVGKSTLVAFVTTGGANLKLCTAGASENVNGTALGAGGSYVATGINFTPGTTWGAGAYSAGISSVTNSGAAITQANMPAGTITQVEIWDTAGSPIRWWFGAITSVTTNAGDTLTFATSALTAQFQI